MKKYDIGILSATVIAKKLHQVFSFCLNNKIDIIKMKKTWHEGFVRNRQHSYCFHIMTVIAQSF